MNDREAMICRLKELIYSNTYCALDTLIRIDEKTCFIDCNNCSFRDIEADILMCPQRYLIKVEVL